ncbi:MAG: hypothetical protein M3Q45_11770, partial [Chloroflexota bacterium]|nr:hypothetical protein [Chloroflexota bacterium]
LLGRLQLALDIFRQAEQTLPAWRDTDGKEVLYFLIGREELALNNDQAAEKAALQALEINQDYARAQIVLAGVYYVRAQRLPSVERLLAPSALILALTQYEKGVVLARQAQDPLLLSIAELALARAQRVKAETYYINGDLDNANVAFDQATAGITATIPILTDAQQVRLVAQAYQSLGAAYYQQADVYRQQNDPAGQRQHWEQARVAFASCIDQGKQAPLDQYLHEEIIAKICQPQQANVEKALGELEGK